MDIYAKSGTKVKFKGNKLYRWAVDPKNADCLITGNVYTVDRMEIHSWHTKVYLKEHPNIELDSSWFDDME